MITPKMKRRIKSEMSAERPTIWVGKDGATPKLLDEISRQLEKREIVKVRILKTALKQQQAKDLSAEIARQTESTLVEVRGHTLLLYKHRRRER